MATTPKLVGPSDPALLKSFETQTPSVARTSPPTVSATGTATSTGSTVSRSIAPTVAGETTTYTQATQASSGTELFIVSSNNNDSNDIVTVYNTQKEISVSAVNQTINNYKVTNNNTYGDSNVVTLLSAFGSNTITTTGNVSVGNITATNLGNIANINLTGSNSNVLYGNGVFAPASGGGNANTGNWEFRNDTMYNMAGGEINNGDTTHGATAGLVLPENGNAGGGASLFNTYGNVQIAVANLANSANTSVWNFGVDGTTTFPTANVDIHNGGVQSGEVLQFGNPNLQSIITGPTPGANVSAQRIIIQGQRGNGTGEGGDVYVWGGDADTNGGDIKIYAGDADNVSAGTGGYVNIDGGDGFDSGGGINIDGGSSANATGGHVSIAGGYGQIDGGTASLQGGYGADGQGGAVQITGGGSSNGTGSFGNVVLGSGVSGWIFDNTGNLTLPADATISDYNDTVSLNVDGSGRYAQLYWNGNIGNGNPDTGGDYYTWAYVGDDGFTVQHENASTSTNNEWKFGIDGNLTLPTGTPSINYANGSPYGGGGGGANTGNVTFNDQVVVGTGDDTSGIGGLYLAPGTASTANLQYLRVRGGDVATHIHFDTGNNIYFDQYFGDDGKFVKLEATGNVLIGSNDTVGNSAQWTFGADGNLTFPTGNLVITPDDPAGNIASIVSTDHPLGMLSTGANGAAVSIWIEDYANVGISNIAAVYANPTPESKIVRIAVGQNGSPGPNLWDFDNAGNLTLPTNGHIIVGGGIVGGGASPAPYISGFDSIGALEFTNGNSNVTVNSNSNLWKFDSTGNLTIPGSSGGFIKTVSNASIGIAAVDNGTNNPAQLMSFNVTANAPTSIISAYASNATIQTNATGTLKTWSFDNAGNLTAPGTVSAINFSGNGSQLTSLPAPTVAQDISSNGAMSIMLYDGNIKYNNYATVEPSTGNIAGGNISTTGVVTANTANITTGNITTINSGLLQNGNSNITITSNGNVSIQAAGSNVELVVTSTGANVTGTLSATGNISGNTNGFAIGYLNIPQVSAANATLALTDAGKHYYSTTAGNLTLTIPTNANVAFATGTAVSIVVQAAGNILVNAASGVTLYMAGNSTAANRVVGGYGMATLMKVASDTWFINGAGVA